MEGVDYSTARPSISGLWNAGKRFACRYLAYMPNPKVLTPGELNALQSQGLGVVLNWEQAAGDMLKGRALGVTHAQEALRQANLLGAPGQVPVYFSCDVQITNSSAMDAVAAYLNGAASVLGKNRVGVYGQYSVIERMVGSVCDWGWQTYAWSGGQLSGKAHIYQYHNGVIVAGADCDLNRSLKDNFGAWYANARSSDVAGFARDDVTRQLYYINGMESRPIPDDRTIADINYTAGQGLSPAIARGPAAGDAEWEKGGLVRKGWNENWAGAIRKAPVISDAQITDLANKLATVTDSAVIKAALIDVLTKGTNNAA